MKFFHILSDGKTVQEITKSEYFRLLGTKWNRLVGWIEPSTNPRDIEVCLVKNENIVTFRIEQMRQVLEKVKL